VSSESVFASPVDADEVRAAPLTRVIAERVAALRGELSGAKLAARMNDYGVPWNRNTVAKFETGRRESLTVQELLALAGALDVPPVLLLADPRTGDAVPVGAGRDMPADDALAWLIGADDGAAETPHGEFMAAWLRTRQARKEWESVRRARLRMTSKLARDMPQLRETETMLRDEYVKAFNELGRFLPDPHVRGAAIVGDDLDED
jgi:transcriptional regulator with XRE-family HTH domain